MFESLDGYVGDVAYAAHYHRATAPAWLHCVATALGRRAPDPSRPYRWCELGCGPGFGASVLAAANPHGVVKREKVGRHACVCARMHTRVCARV